MREVARKLREVARSCWQPLGPRGSPGWEPRSWYLSLHECMDLCLHAKIVARSAPQTWQASGGLGSMSRLIWGLNLRPSASTHPLPQAASKLRESCTKLREWVFAACWQPPGTRGVQAESPDLDIHRCAKVCGFFCMQKSLREALLKPGRPLGAWAQGAG